MFLGTLGNANKQIKVPYILDWEHGIALHAMQGIGPHFTAKGKSHCFSRVEIGTRGIFSSYGGDDPSKLMFVQRRQDS